VATSTPNAALYLRRPLLLTGSPGAGKSTLAHAVAYELGLGRVLHWPIVSRSTLQDGLYRYDAIARLQDNQIAAHSGTAPPGGIGSYIRLGPLGTALLPTAKPRVLLIDELDKSDIDLPNDLLNVMEEGEYGIPELERLAEREPQVDVLRHQRRHMLRHPHAHASPRLPHTEAAGQIHLHQPGAQRCRHPNRAIRTGVSVNQLRLEAKPLCRIRSAHTERLPATGVNPVHPRTNPRASLHRHRQPAPAPLAVPIRPPALSRHRHRIRAMRDLQARRQRHRSTVPTRPHPTTPQAQLRRPTAEKNPCHHLRRR
jgi:hypothetical protein